MTNKGAIAILRNISMWNMINGDEYNALKMAIKALEKEGHMRTCPSCGLEVHTDFKNCPRCGKRIVRNENAEYHNGDCRICKHNNTEKCEWCGDGNNFERKVSG